MMHDASAVLRVLRRALDHGQVVEIEGYGKFRRQAGRYEFVPEARLNVFIAYVEEDLEQVRRLRDGLVHAGFTPWIDKDQLLAGQNWTRAIEHAIELSDAFIACLSPHSLAKRGQFQAEVRCALRWADRMLLEEPFLLPVRLEACRVPYALARHVQYVDLFPDFDRGLRQLVRALRKRKPALTAPISLGPSAPGPAAQE